MFILLLVLFFSLILEAVLVIFTSPETSSGLVNHISVIPFAINTGVIVGSIYSLLLVFLYFKLKAYEDLRTKTFLRRGILLGMLTSLVVGLKIYNYLDLPALGFLFIIFLLIEFIFSKNQ